jgi:MFS family permease
MCCPATPARADSPGAPGRWLVLLLVALSYFNLYLQRSLVNYIQPPLARELGVVVRDNAGNVVLDERQQPKLDDKRLGLLVPWFFAPYAIAQLGLGYLGDRFRRRSVLLLSLAGSAAVLALMGFVQSYGQLLALRAAMALFQAPSVPAIGSAMADCFTPRTRSTAVGIYLASYNVALIAAGHFGGGLADVPHWQLPLELAGLQPTTVAGWRMAMLVFAAVGVAAVLLVLVAFREPARTERTAGAGLGEGGGSLAATLLAVLSTRTFLAIAGVFLLTTIVINGMQFWLPRYLQNRFDLDLQAAGLQSTLWLQSGTILGLLLGGPWADAWARRFLAGRTSVQLAGLAAATPALVVVGLVGNYPLLATAMFVYGLGVGLYQSNLWTTTFEVIDPAARSTALGLLNVIAGAIGSWFNPLIGGAGDKWGSLGYALAALAVLLAASAVVLVYDARWLLPRDYRGPRPT